MAHTRPSRPDSGRGGLVFKAHRLLYHSTLGLEVEEKEGLIDRAKPETLSTESLKSASGTEEGAGDDSGGHRVPSDGRGGRRRHQVGDDQVRFCL